MASYTLQNENMTAIFSDGLLRSLRLKDQPLEYMGNPENTSYSSILEKNQWMGDWRFRVWQGDRFVEELTSRSRAMQSVEADNMSVTVRYEGEAREEGGLSSLSLCQRFSLKEKALEWEAVLTNRTGERLEVGEASLAFLTNTDFAGIFQDPSLKEVPNWHGEKQRRFHEERLFQHLHIGGATSYALLQRPKGDWPALLFHTAGDTCLEAAYQMDKHVGNQFSVVFEGPYYLCCYSNGALRCEEWNALTEATRVPPCGNRSLVLDPGESRRFFFRFTSVYSTEEVKESLLTEGRIALEARPGMVAPVSQPILFSVWAGGSVHLQPNANMKLELLKQERNRYDYRLTADQPGQKHVIVHHDQEISHLFFLLTEEPSKLLKRRAAFIAKYQFYDNLADPWNRYHVFMPYDDMLGTLFLDSLETWQVSGTDELCLPTAMFLAEQNCRFPVETEIETLETFVEEGLFGKLQDRETYLTVRSLRWVPEKEIYPSDKVYYGKGGKEWANSTNRCFQYALISDFYFSMYRLAKAGRTRKRTGDDYLEMTYRTALNWFNDSVGDNKWNGGPSGATIIDILDALEKEKPEWFQKLNERVSRAAALNARAVYPYGSELYVDQTSHNQLYTMLAHYGYWEKAAEVRQVTKTLRNGHQPTWYQFGNDKRGNVSCWYGTPMNSHVLYEKYDVEGDEDALRLGYGGLSSFLSTVRQDGAAHGWFLCWPDRFGFDRRSLDTDMGLYNYLRYARAYAVQEPVFGWVGYGCQPERKENGLEIVVLDGVGSCVTIPPLELRITSECGGIHKIELDEKRRRCIVRLAAGSAAEEKDIRLVSKQKWTMEIQ